MTAMKINVLACDHADCTVQIASKDRESAFSLRVRVRKENGWRSAPSNRRGGYTDLCRWHA